MAWSYYNIGVGDYAFYNKVDDRTQGVTTLHAELKTSEKLKHIGKYAFGGCNYLTGELDLSGITDNTIDPYICSTYGGWSTDKSSISKLTIGKNIETLGEGAFYGLGDLKTVVIEERTEPITGENDSFGGMNGIARDNVTLKLGISKSNIGNVGTLVKNLDGMGLSTITNIDFTNISSSNPLTEEQLTKLGLTANNDVTGTYSVGSTSTSIKITYSGTDTQTASLMSYTPALAARKEELTIEV